MFKKPNDIPGFLSISGFVNEEPKYDDKQRPFTFTSNLHENSFNWQNVYNWDPVSIKKDHDVEKMQEILNHFVKSNFTSSDLQVIQNPLIFRLLQVLQIVVEYIAHSQTEIQTLYGKTVHENSVLKTSISRYKVKNERLVSALRNMKEVEKCPICFSYFDSNISLDRHIHKNHYKIYDLWEHVRENKEFSPQEEVKRLNLQIDAMRVLIKKQQNKIHQKREEMQIAKEEDAKSSKEEDVKSLQEKETKLPKEGEKSNGSTDNINYFELSSSYEDENKSNNSDKKIKYIIDSDYQPFHKAVHHDDGPYLVFQDMSDFSITLEPQEIIEQRAKKGMENKFYKKAKLFLENEPEKCTLKKSPHNFAINENVSKNNINLDYNEIDDPNKIQNSKKVKIDVHDQAHEVKMSHMEKGPKWRVRKKVERELKEYVPDLIPKSTIHELFDKLNYYADKNFISESQNENIQEEEEEEEETETEEEEEIELTSACYSSLLYSSEKAQYYSHDGGGTTRSQQARPSLYNPGGRRFPIKGEVHPPNKPQQTKIESDDEFAPSSSSEQKKETIKPKTKNESKPKAESNSKADSKLQTESNSKTNPKTSANDEQEKSSLSDLFSNSSSHSNHPPKPSKSNGNIELLPEVSFSSGSDKNSNPLKKYNSWAASNSNKTTPSSTAPSTKKKVKKHKKLKIEEEEEVTDAFFGEVKKTSPKSAPSSHRRKKGLNASKNSPNQTNSSQKSSKNAIEIIEEEEEEMNEVEKFSKSQITKSKKIKNSVDSKKSKGTSNENDESPKSVPSSHRRRRSRSSSKNSINQTNLSQKSSKNAFSTNSIDIIEEEEEVDDVGGYNKNNEVISNKKTDDFDSFDEPLKSVSVSHRKKKSQNKGKNSPSKLTSSQKSSQKEEESKTKNDYDFDSISWDD